MLSPETQNTDISTAPVVFSVETIPLCQGLVFATGTRREVHRHQQIHIRTCHF